MMPNMWVGQPYPHCAAPVRGEQQPLVAHECISESEGQEAVETGEIGVALWPANDVNNGPCRTCGHQTKVLQYM